MFKVIIAGSRDFSDYTLLTDVMDQLLKDEPEVEIVSGTARGADSLGERYAADKGYKLTKFPADWNTYGKSAGYRRNVEMADYADGCVVFWDSISKGTKHMIDIATSKGLKLCIVEYNKL